jgi:hypothetical protein
VPLDEARLGRSALSDTDTPTRPGSDATDREPSRRQDLQAIAEPVTLVAWLNEEASALTPDDQVVVLHPDPPLGRDELQTLDELARLCGLGDRREILTPRGLAIRGI